MSWKTQPGVLASGFLILLLNAVATSAQVFSAGETLTQKPTVAQAAGSSVGASAIGYAPTEHLPPLALFESPASDKPPSDSQRLPFGAKPENDRRGSTDVPMDSWIYPALERIAALGFIPSQQVSIRPWTRQECLRQLQEAEQGIANAADDEPRQVEAGRLLSDLRKELSEIPDSDRFVLESLYARYGAIAGSAITNSLHFGQTWWNDYGRPLGRGGSAEAGGSFRATRGRYFLFAREELQQSPGTLGLTQAQAQLFTALDNFSGNPANNPATYQATISTAAYTRQRPLELYAGMAFAGNSISFGKQDLFWGPTVMGPLSFSMNAEPTYNLRFVADRPHRFPFVPWLGSYRFDIVAGKLSGHRIPARAYYNGQKIDLLFGHNLEMSFTRWSILWGVGHPMTLHSLLDNLFSANSAGSQYGYGNRTDPGDRKSGFDFRLHVPGTRNIVTIYADSYADDEPNPIDAPRRVVWSPGIYFARLPYIPHTDLRIEAASSEELSHDEGGQRFFINNEYLDGNTNKGFFLGNAVGRDGRAIEVRSTHWLSARSKIEVGFRQNKGGTQFLPGGSTVTDVFVNSSHTITEDWTANAFVQYERFAIPSFMPGFHRNGSGWLQITWTPRHAFLKSKKE